MRSIHVASWIDAVGKPTAAAFVVLFSLTGFTRALLITVIPLNANAWLGDAQKVSVLFFGVSLAGVLISLGVPWLVHKIRRRNVFALGIALTLLACGLMAMGPGGGIVTGMFVNAMAIAALEIALNLYIMDHIPGANWPRSSHCAFSSPPACGPSRPGWGCGCISISTRPRPSR